MTNADKIRNMTNKELAEFICNCSDCRINMCPMYEECGPNGPTWDDGKIKWLESEAK